MPWPQRQAAPKTPFSSRLTIQVTRCVAEAEASRQQNLRRLVAQHGQSGVLAAPWLAATGFSGCI